MPKSGTRFSPTEPQIRKFHTALLKVLQNTVSNVTAKLVATFKQENVALESALERTELRIGSDWLFIYSLDHQF